MRRLVVVTLLVLASAAAAAWAAAPVDPYYPQESWLRQIGWTPAQASSTLAYPTIAVVDTGVSHATGEFTGLITPDSASCTQNAARAANDPLVVDDTVGHGTQVAALAAAPENGIGIVGVSPYAPLVVVKITDDPNDLSHLTCGLSYLTRIAAQGPLIVNLSLAVSPTSPARVAVQRAIDRLVARGALIVAATGNRDATGPNAPIQLPAAFPHVLAVGDSALTHLLAGRQLSLLAPGTNLVLPQLDGSWQLISGPGAGGTSFSAALVSGAASLLWGHLPKVTNPEQIEYMLRASTGRRWDAAHGFGTINLSRALRLKVPPDNESEPNDTPASASHAACNRRCVLYGIASAVDDPVDFWRLPLRRCPRINHTSTVTVNCKRVSGGVLVRVATGSPQTVYRLAVG
jgi:subtilisin family serine protease